MIKNKKEFIIRFAIAFGATAVFTAFMMFVVFRGVFYNAYISKGDKQFEKGNYTEAIELYKTARSWKGKRLGVYLSLAKTYAAAEDFVSAGEILSEAIDKKITTEETGVEQLHLMRIRVYSAAGQLTEAVNYTDGIDDQYMRKKIQEARPADIAYTPNQGSYDKTLKMTMTVREGETIYYTTDGTYPTKFSNIYVDPINIGVGETKITAVAVDAQGLVSPFLSVTYNVTNEYQEVEFDDPKVELMVRESLSKPTGRIRVKELEAVTWLSSYGIEGQIRTLSDLDLMPNLESLSLEDEHSITSFSNLSGKSKLTHLTVINCGLETNDLNAFGGLTALELLDISDNNVSSISVLSNLTGLKYVYLAQNRIDDLSPLTSATSLECIDAHQNNLTSIPDFTSQNLMTTLILGSNRISDISAIHHLTELTYLDVSKNLISNGKNLSKLEKLDTLNVSGNNLTNFDFLSSLPLIRHLDVSSTSFVSTKPIAELNLLTFNANNTGLATLDDIAKYKELISLEIAQTNVTDISFLNGLDCLDYLDISYCDIEDVSVLSGLKGLFTLKAPGIDVSSVKFFNTDIMVVS